MPDVSGKSRKSKWRRFWLLSLTAGLLWLVLTDYKYRLPDDLNNICSIFNDRRDWYRAARKSEKRWGTPAHVQMAIIHQESSFEFNARPPRRRLLGFIPWARPSNAYGYAQALDSTWDRYKIETEQPAAVRDHFDNAIDFVGWYTDKSNAVKGISKWDPYNQYLAYHEGHAGWSRGSYNQKAWLKKAAKSVDRRARKWSTQLNSCQEELDDRWWIFNAG